MNEAKVLLRTLSQELFIINLALSHFNLRFVTDNIDINSLIGILFQKKNLLRKGKYMLSPL
jgi:hypothetical protein